MINFLKKISFTQISRLCLGLFIIFFPFQIRTLIFSNPLYLTGEFNYFTSTFIYLSDFFLIISFLAFGLAIYQNSNLKISFGNNKITVAILLLIATAIIITPTVELKTVHLINIIKLIELFLFYILIVNEILSEKKLSILLFSTIAFQSLIGIFQYMTQSSLGLKILGEPLANPQTLGVAKFTYNNETILRSYGTFAHSNVFGGIIAICMIYLSKYFNTKTWIVMPLILLFSTTLIMSFSRSSYIAIFTAILIYIAIGTKKIPWKKIGVAISLTILIVVSFGLENKIFQRIIAGDNQAVTERISYLNSSYAMIQKYPFGLGLGNFTQYLPDFTTIKLTPWNIQPVHNIFFLITNELGLPGLICFAGIFMAILYELANLKRIIQTQKQENTRLNLMALLFSIMILGSFDHYLLTSPQGLTILFFYLGIASNFVNKSLLPFKNS